MDNRIGQLLIAATEALTSGTDSPRLDAEILLASILRVPREWLLTHPDVEVPNQRIHEYERLLEGRLDGQPVAYLTGVQDFFGLPIGVTPDVLVPRPATELLVTHVLDALKQAPDGALVDVGTGSGAIALALAEHLPGRAIIGTDTSLPALRVAATNARRLRLAGRTDWRAGSLLGPVTADPVGIIIANLPYLHPDQMTEPSIQAEPPSALLSGHDGLAHIKALLRQTAEREDWRGLVIEFDPTQAQAISTIITNTWPEAAQVPLSDGNSVRGIGVWR